jgi:hypothetical protein
MRSQASPRRRGEEEFMMSSNMGRPAGHVAVAIPGRVTP